jgi:hypothetical protein
VGGFRLHDIAGWRIIGKLAGMLLAQIDLLATSATGVGMAAKQAMLGLGIFQWNTGGWFGTQIGSTAWMLLAAAGVAPWSIEMAAVGLLCFAGPNSLGAWLWQRRDRIAPGPAIELLLLSISGSSLILLFAFEWFAGVPRTSLWPGYAVCLIMPVKMVGWRIVESVKARRSLRPGGAEHDARADGLCK